MISKKASVTLYITFLIVATVIIIITAVMAPFGALFTTEMYLAGQDILAQTNDSIQAIQNTTIRNSVQSTINLAFAAAEDNIEVTTDMYQYGWVIVVALTAIIIFLITRQLVEAGRGGVF